MSDTSSYLFYQTRNPRPFLDHGEGIYLIDESGKRYIDGSSGAMVCNIGHSNPRVLAKIKAQMDKATFGYRLHFRTRPSEDLAAKTVSLMPEGLDRVFFVSGGSEAVESAVKLARQYAITQGEAARYKVISRFPSYHGSTFGALELTGYDPLRKPFAPMLQFLLSITNASNPRFLPSPILLSFRNRHGGNEEPLAGEKDDGQFRSNQFLEWCRR